MTLTHFQGTLRLILFLVIVARFKIANQWSSNAPAAIAFSEESGPPLVMFTSADDIYALHH